MKALRAAFAFLLAGAACVLGLRVRNGVETDLYCLADAQAGGVLGEIASGLSGRGRILLEGGDFESVKVVASGVREFFGQPPERDFNETLKFLDGHKSGLLASETREQLLAGKYREVARGALARLCSPAPRLLSVKDDPFLLATEYVTALQTELADGWMMREGFPVCEREGSVFLLQTPDLTGVPASKLAEFAMRCACDAAPFGSNVKVWTGGAPFHSAVASERSKREIGLLSGISLLCVLSLGCVLFRSLRFLPLLVFAQGAGFLVATAALFLFFPRPHVLTFVFGTSLIGLSVDYVYHAQTAGDVRRILRPLTLSLLTTVVCFVPLLFAEVIVLRQMALFSVTGLAASYAAVLLWPASRFCCSAAVCAVRKTRFLPQGRGMRILFGMLMVFAAAGLFRVKTNDDPATFYRPNEYLLASERVIAQTSPGRSQRFAFVRGATLQEALEREESLGIKGLSAVIPSLKRQRENAALIARLTEAEGADYTARTGLAMPHGRDPEFLDPERLEDGPLLQMVRTMRVGGGLISPIPENAVVPAGAEVLDPRTALQGLFRHWTSATLKLLAVSCFAFMLVTAFVFRRRMLHFLLPVALSAGATAGTLGWTGIPLTFFTMLCFFVLAGLGIDYVIFRMSDSSAGTCRTVFFAFLTSFAGLGSLALTGFPVTHAMGVTFAVGLFFAWLCARFVVSSSAETAGGIAWHEQCEQSAGRLRLQFMWFVYARFGKNAQKIVAFFVMLFIFPFARPARRALARFYDVLAAFRVAHGCACDAGECFCPQVRLFRHLLGFAWSLADKTDACTLKKNLPRMTVRDDAGRRAFRNLTCARKGAFLISTHVGTIEVLPALAASAETPVPHVHAFQQMGHDAVFTQMFMRHFDARAFTLHAVESIGVETAVGMQEAIRRGELVLMAGDRVSAGSAKTLSHDFLGQSCRWPKGVFKFAKLMDAPVFFVTCVRTGWNAYECRFRKFETDCASPLPFVSQLLDRYVDFLQEETLAHPGQWYQFYDFWA